MTHKNNANRQQNLSNQAGMGFQGMSMPMPMMIPPIPMVVPMPGMAPSPPMGMPLPPVMVPGPMMMPGMVIPMVMPVQQGPSGAKPGAPTGMNAFTESHMPVYIPGSSPSF